jgi:hypothetical protein
MKRVLVFLGGFALLLSASAAPTNCKKTTIERSLVEMCLVPGAAFQHDVYTMKVDNVMVSAFVDDYVEKVELEHSVPEGLAIEFPLSKQGEKIARIKGGCVPESKDGAQVARVCNFSWGCYQVVKDVRFDFN